MLPKEVIAVLWSYNSQKINPDIHKKAIIAQVLNFGNSEASKWLFRYYGKDEIAKVAKDIPLTQWDKKSLALWSAFLQIEPKERRERIEKNG